MNSKLSGLPRASEFDTGFTSCIGRGKAHLHTEIVLLTLHKTVLGCASFWRWCIEISSHSRNAMVKGRHGSVPCMLCLHNKMYNIEFDIVIKANYCSDITA